MIHKDGFYKPLVSQRSKNIFVMGGGGGLPCGAGLIYYLVTRDIAQSIELVIFLLVGSAILYGITLVAILILSQHEESII